MARHFTVTHPDDSVATRKSENAVYTHAVVVVIDRSAKADYLESVEVVEAEAERERTVKTLAEGESVERRSSYGDYIQCTYFKVLGGHEVWTGDNRDKPVWDEVARIDGRIQSLTDEIARLREAGGLAYSVVRWSSRRDLAQKAADGEFSRISRPYRTVEVAEVAEVEKAPRKPRAAKAAVVEAPVVELPVELVAAQATGHLVIVPLGAPVEPVVEAPVAKPVPANWLELAHNAPSASARAYWAARCGL